MLIYKENNLERGDEVWRVEGTQEIILGGREASRNPKLRKI
jgi:hypothetical protein